MTHLLHVLNLCKQVQAKRIMIGGSFITPKLEPSDVDVTILVADDFFHLAKRDDESPHFQLKQLWIQTEKPLCREIDLSIERTSAGFWSLFGLYFVPKDVQFISDGQDLYTGLVEVFL